MFQKAFYWIRRAWAPGSSTWSISRTFTRDLLGDFGQRQETHRAKFAEDFIQNVFLKKDKLFKGVSIRLALLYMALLGKRWVRYCFFLGLLIHKFKEG